MLNVEFTGAQVLGADALEPRPLAVAQGLITDVAQTTRVDLDGYMIVPGIVDVHGDGFERHLAPVAVR